MSLLDHPEAQALLDDAILSPDTVRRCADRLTDFLQRYLPKFYRVEQRENGATVIRGLLSGLERKTCEPIATEAGVPRQPIPFFVGAGKWDDEAVMAELRAHVREELAEPGGVVVIDPSAFPKKGTASCGVARQWCGRLGQVENCQVGVFLAYAVKAGYAPLDRRLYLPEDWANDEARREKCHVPQKVEFREKWRIALDGCGRNLMLIFPFGFGTLTPSLHLLSGSQAVSAHIVGSFPDSITIQITVPFGSSMLDFETALQRQLNEAGNLATAEQLRRFDTDGSPIQVGPTTLYSKGQLPKEYQTPYDAVSVERHVYQSAQGGATFCPLERDARIVVTSTPLFAKIVSSKYAEFGSARVRRDLRDNHGRAVSKCLVQDLADAVAAVALAKEESWTYRLPRWDVLPATVSVGLDGSCMHLSADGWRETMVGTLGFYDADGERLHTISLGATPEYGKATFLERLTREVERAKAELPGARYVGIADGAKDRRGRRGWTRCATFSNRNPQEQTG